MMITAIKLGGVLLAAVVQVDAFSPSRTQHIITSRSASTITPTTLHDLQRPVGGLHFQLEELEDAETSTTDVLLNTDATVTLGGTNGPLYKDAHGTWTENSQFVQDDQNEGETFKREFEMKLTRTFITGADNDNEMNTDVGEFEYSVERTYAGECFLVGGSVFAMNGEIMDVDEIFGERRVGFFNMIDTTEEREINDMD